MDSVSPFVIGVLAVLLMTSFVKILASLSVLMYGLGLQSLPFNLIAILLSLALSLLVMSPQLEASGGLASVFGASEEHLVEEQMRPFLERNTDERLKQRFSEINAKRRPEGVETTGETPLGPLLSAFLIGELRAAFQLGFVLLVPFLVIDLAVANILMALGVTQLPAASVALPLKILLFFSVDGWTMIAEKLIAGYS